MTAFRTFSDFLGLAIINIQLVTCQSDSCSPKLLQWVEVQFSTIFKSYLLGLFLHNPVFIRAWHFLFFVAPVSLVLFMKSNGNIALKTSQSKLNSILLVSAEPSDPDWQCEANNPKKRKQQKCGWVNCTLQVSVSIISPRAAAQRSHCDGCGRSRYLQQSWSGCAVWACHWASGLGSFQSPGPKSSQE